MILKKIAPYFIIFLVILFSFGVFVGTDDIVECPENTDIIDDDVCVDASGNYFLANKTQLLTMPVIIIIHLFFLVSSFLAAWKVGV